MPPARMLLVLLAAIPLAAQTITPPEKIPERWRNFDKPERSAKLQCNVHATQPTLSLAFLFQTGYTIDVPLRQFTAERNQLVMVLRVTPEQSEREPVWLSGIVRFGQVPPGTKAIAELGGGYVVGEGRYRVDLLLTDNQERRCVDSWNIRAKLTDDVRQVRPGLPAGAVDDISLRRWNRASSVSQSERRYNVSFLLHAAPSRPGRVRLRPYDRMVLMSALASIIERLPVRNVRLTVFSMDRQKELFHTTELDSNGFQRASDVLNTLELGTVDLATLQNRTGHIDLVASMLQRETTASQPPDALIVIAPAGRTTDRVPEEALPKSAPVYHIQLRPWRFLAGLPADTLSKAVKALGGKTKEVYSPDDFAEAIVEIERLLATRREQAASH